MNNGLVYLTYNSEQPIVRNFGNLFNTRDPLNVTVIDNASTDQTVPLLERSGIPVHVNDDNIGFAAGINIGLKKLLDKDLEWIFIINPDVKCPEHWDTVVDGLTDNLSCGIVGVRLVDSSGQLVHSGGIASEIPQLVMWPTEYDLGNSWSVTQGDAVTAMHFRHDLFENGVQKCAWVSFSAVALRVDMLRQIGLLDETYFFYCSDIQLCMRAWQQNWQVWYNPVTFSHEVGASVRRADSEAKNNAQADMRRFVLSEEKKWLHSLADILPKKM